MNTKTETYNHKAELDEALINLAWMQANAEELDRLRAKYAYADTAEYAARCAAAQAK